jgi:hypothetical protein
VSGTESESDTYPTPEHGWTCFHCGENFAGTFGGQRAARLHFGASIHDEPKCQISARRLRVMEDQLRRYREEDTDLHRDIARLKSDHAIALRRAEEQGSERALKDTGYLAALENHFLNGNSKPGDPEPIGIVAAVALESSGLVNLATSNGLEAGK